MIVGVGVDLVEIERVRRLLQRKGDRALVRLFTRGEQAYAAAHREPVRQLAARIAAKEATYKALSGNELARAIGWRELEVVSTTGHAPSLVLHGRALERATELGATRLHLSLTHSESAACAFVIAERLDGAGA